MYTLALHIAIGALRVVVACELDHTLSLFLSKSKSENNIPNFVYQNVSVIK